MKSRTAFYRQRVERLAVPVLLLLVVSLLFTTPATAAGGTSITRTYQPDNADSYVQSTAADTNYGTTTNMNVGGGTGPPDCDSYIKFNLGEVPAGVNISSSSLQVYLYSFMGSSTHRIRRVTADWAEGTVTWNNQPAYSGTDTATAAITTQAVWINWTVTSDVQAWKQTQTASNYGWAIVDNVTSAFLGSYYTKEYVGDTSLRPKLAVTFTAPWDSYQESERTNVKDLFDASYTTAYMKATGFLEGNNYNVSYYDGDGNITRSENNIAVAGDGILVSSILFSDYSSAAAGTWHALVQPAGGYSSLPDTYAAAVAAPDTYGLLANDSFEVDASAIPEFPTIMSGIAVTGACIGIYLWMRRTKRISV